MKQKHIQIIFVILLGLVFYQCARRGSPTGGPKDETPPVLLKAIPELESVHFNSDKIKLYFDEYINTSDLQKQLIISPPLKYFLEFIPASGATKKLEIRIKDTLRANTTYVLNFGNGIKDYNEGNELPFFKYVFSTGNSIDSLTVEGSVQDAINIDFNKSVTVMLYEKDSLYKDSIVYREKPMYISNVKDSLKTFKIENVKSGKYILVAIQDKNNNYIFDSQSEKIGFLNHPIELPTDSLYSITLFKEVPKYKAARPFQISDNRILFGYTGMADSIKIEAFSSLPENFKSLVTKEFEKDSLNYWFFPKPKDSISFLVHNQTEIDTFRVRLKDMKKDSLQISISEKSKKITPEKYFRLKSNIPLTALDSTKINITKKDSTKINFSPHLLNKGMQCELRFEVELGQDYKIKILPEAFTDFYGNTNDTLSFKTSVGTQKDYSSLKVNLILINLKYPIILQLTDKKGKEIKEELYATEPKDEFIFNYIEPGTYRLRAIEDRNKNHKWDTGNFLQSLQPEKIIYFPKELDLRANWEVKENWK